MRDNVIKPPRITQFNKVADSIPEVAKQNLDTNFKKIYEPLLKALSRIVKCLGRVLKTKQIYY